MEKTGGKRGDVEACEGVGAVGVSVRKEKKRRAGVSGWLVGDEAGSRWVGEN